jgi:translocation and assembly module TamB
MATTNNTSTSPSKKRLSAGLRAEREDSELPRRKPRRWLLKSMLVLCTLVWCTPYIIAYTPLKDAVLRWAMKDQLNGSLTVGSLSLGWLSPIGVEEITLVDNNGQAVAKVAKVETSLRLWQFVSNPTDLGTIKVTSPALSLAADNTTTNLEQVLAPMLKPSDEPSKPRDIRIEVVEGSLAIQDLVTKKTWTLDQLNVALSQKHDLPLPTDWSASGRIPLDNRVATFHIGSGAPVVQGMPAGQAGPPAPVALPAATAGQAITLQTDALPLEMFRWAVARGLGEVELSGFLRSSGVLVNRDENGVAHQDFRGEIAIDQLFVGGKALKGDQVQLASIHIPCDLSASPDSIDIRSLKVECEMAQLSAQGKIPLKVDPAKNDAFAMLRESLALDGTVNLPMLTQQLRNTLGITPGTQLTSGEVIAKWISTRDATGTVWNGSVRTNNIGAINNGQRISLQTPLVVEVSARDTASGPIIEKVMASAKFLNVTGTGNLDQLTVEGTCDLNEMARELGQLIDLSTLKPAGTANLKVVWNKAADGRFTANLNSILDQFSLTLPGNLTMREPRLAINAAASGSVSTSGMTRLDAGELVVEAPPAAGTTQVDRMSVTLKQPINLPTGSGASWTTALLSTNLPLELRLQGELAAWQPRLATFLPLAGYRMAGVADIAAAGQFSSTRMQLASLNGKIQPAQFVGAGMYINEATMQLSGSADVDLPAQRLTLPQLTIQSSAVAAELTETEVLWPAKGMTARGKARYQANLAQLQTWTIEPGKDPSYRYSGTLSGDCVIATGGPTTQVTMNNSIEQFVIYDYKALKEAQGQNVAPLWHEQVLKINVRGAMDTSTDVISAESIEVQSQAIALRTSGKLNGLNGAKPTIELAGKIDYDWNTLAPLIKNLTGDVVVLKGRQSSDFTLAGPLDLTAPPSQVASNVTMVSRPSAAPVTDSFAMIKPVSATATVGWEELLVYGIPLQRGQMELQLRDGLFGFQKPFVIQAEEGKITLSPTVRLTPGPMEIILPNAMVVEQFKMTPDMASKLMKYMAPVLADATAVEGRFSLGVTEGRIPVDQWQRMTMTGKATMHGLQVMPGPKSEMWVGIARQLKGVLSGGGLAALTGGAGGEGGATSMIGNGLSAAGGLLNGGGLSGLAGSLGGGTGAAAGATGTDQKQTVLLRMPEQTIDYAVQDGKVYHQGLTMEIDNLVVRTRGYVGLDNTLGLVLEVPLRDEWIQKFPALAQLPNKAIALNIGGTVDKPQINSAELRQLVMSMGSSVLQDKVLGGVQEKLGSGVDGLQQKATDQINGLQQKADGMLNKQFDKLFGK